MCDLDADDPSCDCLVHRVYQACGGKETLKPYSEAMKKGIAVQTPKQTREEATNAIVAGFIGQATPQQQIYLATHLFAAAMHDMARIRKEKSINEILKMFETKEITN